MKSKKGRKKAKDTEAQMEGGMNRRATERKRKKVRKIERWVVDGSSGTLGWRLLSVCVSVCACVPQMSNGL